MDVGISGGIRIEGFAIVTRTVRIPLKFKEGDTPYLKYKAIRGTLERIAVRRIRLDAYDQTYGQYYETYYDQHNARYNDTELIDREEAIALASAFYQRLMSKTYRSMEKLLQN